MKPLGIQLHSLREDFKEDPARTLYAIREMGYSGVEMPIGSVTALNEGLGEKGAAYYRRLFAEADLACYGLLTSWELVLPENLERTLEYNMEIGSPFLVIGSVPERLIATEEDADRAVAYMNELNEKILAAGLVTGYHNHSSDFTNTPGGYSFYERVLSNTPESFVMLLDTGNALAGGGDCYSLLEKYPHRSPFFHLKGYSAERDYLADIGEDDFDWKRLLRMVYEVGGTKTVSIEFGKRGDYIPAERAAKAYKTVSRILEEIGL
ncbi:MAG: sugar phosphate isomerase/epimerase [Clostridia bacterium]|nr:sugar phosphate isomerase/epimerase [Clostridia bacterium]